MFLDDAILIEKYLDDYAHTHSLDFADLSTRGALSVHINANRKGNGKRYDHWLDFDVGWCAPGGLCAVWCAARGVISVEGCNPMRCSARLQDAGCC